MAQHAPAGEAVGRAFGFVADEKVRWVGLNAAVACAPAFGVGRPIELFLEDTASDPKIAVGNVRNNGPELIEPVS